MLAIRISLAIFGILLAVFLQAYSLPIFLMVSALLGGWLGRNKPVRFSHEDLRNNPESNIAEEIFLGSYWWLFAATIFLLFGLPLFFEAQASKFLAGWDSLSLISIPSLERRYELGIQHHATAKLAMNAFALIIPLFVAYWFKALLYPIVEGRKFLERLTVLPIIMLIPAFCIWGMSKINLNSFYLEFSLCFFYIFPCLIILLLFRKT